jgi:hypothetical protein
MSLREEFRDKPWHFIGIALALVALLALSYYADRWRMNRVADRVIERLEERKR